VLVGVGVSSGRVAWLVPPAVLLLAGGALLAADRSRSLGHALVEGYVVARSGSFLRRHDALATDAVIGWTFRATWFQRRAGLTSLVATTAGGQQAVTILDAPQPTAVALADAALPGLVGQFLVRPE
jgi:putative membrane protein